MVLHHIPQSTRVIIKRAALFNTDAFGHGDLHIGNRLATPKRLKKSIAKPQCKQILNRRFTQVMVNSENLIFSEDAVDGVVDGTVGGQVVAQRLFKHDARLWAIHACQRDLFTYRGKQIWSRSEVHHHHIG